ncbi:MAG: SCO1664 family protein, partial [Actinobacteria bacterium]|nr:SCO1664 family protein [Actinomycetota bacterium]
MSDVDGLTPAVGLALDGGPGLTIEQAVTLLRDGELGIEGRVVDASNATFYCSVDDGRVRAACVYKPIAGERPLWDFPDGTLAEREVAAYEVSAASGWSVVPPTVLRDGPAGPGMVQLWLDVDETVDLGRFMRRRDLERLREIAVFDAVINNADRKGGHLLPLPDGRVYGVDHGVSFHVEDKLRTVLWQWAGARLPGPLRASLTSLREQFDGALGERLGDLLTRREVRQTRARV